jgi:tellurite resistance protein
MPKTMSQPESEQASRLKNFPIPWFAMIMGLSGLTIAWARAEQTFGLGFALSAPLRPVTALLFAVLTTLYVAKTLRYPQAVLGEMRHPVKQAFAPTFSISLILLSVAFLPDHPDASYWLWTLGALLHLAATLYMLSSWMHHTKYEIGHLNPAWFIPVVGNILVPIAGVHHAPAEISWFFFSVGLFFWPVLTAIIFYRLIFHGSLPERLMPTLFIFIAPPAAGFISYTRLTGGIDAFAHILYGIALFFTLLLCAQIGRFLRLRFFLSWWAYSFPLAAMTIATLIMAKATGLAFYGWLGIGLLAVLTLVIAMLLARTALAVARREICIDDT